MLLLPQRYVFSSKSQHKNSIIGGRICCCCYHKGTYFQANHNKKRKCVYVEYVVVATTKVRIFKQITTQNIQIQYHHELLLLPQRYVFSSKSQQLDDIYSTSDSCCCYHKGTYFQANHNEHAYMSILKRVVVATTKVRIFKQITTGWHHIRMHAWLLLLPQRYVFSSKSQQKAIPQYHCRRCCCYHKGTYFQANHNAYH